MSNDRYTLGEIADYIGAELTGDPNCPIHGVASLGKANSGQISFLVSSRYQLVASSRYEKLLPMTQASAVLLAPEHRAQCPVAALVMKDPYIGLLKMTDLFKKKMQHESGVHPTAIIGQHCNIASSATVGEYVIVGNGCTIGENTVVGSHTVLGDNVTIGADSNLYPRVTIEYDVTIGDRAVIHSGAVIGSEGFGLVRDPKGWQKIPHLGTVLIGNDVEVGANTTIDRGSIDNTVISNGVKLDNLIQVGHGVTIGEHTVIAGCVGIGGSAQIGKNCMIGGATGVGDNITICDNVVFTGMSQVTKSITVPGIYSSGTGIQSQQAWHKTVARLHNLDGLAKKLHRLEKEQQ